MQALAVLDLSDNELVGPIPPILGNLSFTGKLYLHGNKLTGPVSPELGDMSRLSYLPFKLSPLQGKFIEICKVKGTGERDDDYDDDDRIARKSFPRNWKIQGLRSEEDEEEQEENDNTSGDKEKHMFYFSLSFNYCPLGFFAYLGRCI